MNVRVSHTIGDLERDYVRVTAKAAVAMPRIVKKDVEQGNKIAQGIAKRAAGPHGTSYWKRLSGEMTGPLEGEFGPHGDVAGNAVGAGWRHGPPNTDLPKAADIIGPRFAKHVGDLADGLFW